MGACVSTTEAAEKIVGGGGEEGELRGCCNKEAHFINMSWRLLQTSVPQQAQADERRSNEGKKDKDKRRGGED